MPASMNIVFGCMSFCREGSNGPGARIFDKRIMAAQLELYKKHGGKQLDTARMYGGGTGESLLAELGWQEHGFSVDTKLWAYSPTSHRPDDLVKQINRSLNDLGVKKLGLVYLHSPDRSTPYEETLAKLNELHQQGLFEELGLSNYMSWEVAQITELCIKKQWIRPTVFQVTYNGLLRGIEAELIPCLRHYGYKIYAFGITLSGILSISDMNAPVPPGSRFDIKTPVGARVRGRVWNETIFSASAALRKACEDAHISPFEASYRWIRHHSQLHADLGDSILISGSSIDQLSANLDSLAKGPLPDAVVEAFDEGWKLIRGVSPPYFL